MLRRAVPRATYVRWEEWNNMAYSPHLHTIVITGMRRVQDSLRAADALLGVEPSWILVRYRRRRCFDASRQFQAYYDETLRRVGARAPAPILGQSVNDYRRETLRQLKRTFLPPAHDLYQVQYRSLRPDALQALASTTHGSSS
jgi:hypothetical protein